jgi:hypothetical protein
MMPGATRRRVTTALLILSAGLGVINLRLAYENRAAERLSLSLERQIAEELARQRAALDSLCTSCEPPGRTASRQTLLEAFGRAGPTDAWCLVPVEGCVGAWRALGSLKAKLRSTDPQSTSPAPAPATTAADGQLQPRHWGPTVGEWRIPPQHGGRHLYEHASSGLGLGLNRTWPGLSSAVLGVLLGQTRPRHQDRCLHPRGSGLKPQRIADAAQAARSIMLAARAVVAVTGSMNRHS